MSKSIYIFILNIIVLNIDTYAISWNQRLTRLNLPDNVLVKRVLSYHPDSFLNFTQRSSKYGFSAEEHSLVTEDGYILTLFRIYKRSRCKYLRSPPILLQHGMFVNCISWLDAGPKAGLAYLLADECFDVWCCNVRGTEYSRRHINMDPDEDYRYWQFSFHDIGLHDIPKSVDYILKQTDNDRLNIVTHSQGFSSFLVMATAKPEYMEKVQLVIGLAPATRMGHCRSPLFGILKRIRALSADMFEEIGLQEISHTHSIMQETFHYMCHQRFLANNICQSALSVIDGVNVNSISSETLTIMFAHLPDGVALKNVNHFGQLLEYNKFRPYDYGIEDNIQVYGTENVPEYNISTVKTPLVLIHADNDKIVDARDIKYLKSALPNVREMYRVQNPKWNHLDYVWSRYIPKYLFPKIISHLNNFSSII